MDKKSFANIAEALYRLASVVMSDSEGWHHVGKLALDAETLLVEHATVRLAGTMPSNSFTMSFGDSDLYAI